MAAAQRYAKGQRALGIMYDRGEGVHEDVVQAYVWFRVAAAQGDEPTKEAKRIVTKCMIRDQIDKAQRRK